MYDVPKKGLQSWHAYFRCEENPIMYEVRRVNVERVYWDPSLAYYYVSLGVLRVGVWPGTTSDEWIEYIPPPGIVERDGDLWWRHYDAEIDTFRYTQLTKGSTCASLSIPTGSR